MLQFPEVGGLHHRYERHAAWRGQLPSLSPRTGSGCRAWSRCRNPSAQVLVQRLDAVDVRRRCGLVSSKCWTGWI